MVNDLCIAAVGRIDLRMRVQFGGSHPRGTHSVRLFMIHRTQVEVNHSPWLFCGCLSNGDSAGAMPQRLHGPEPTGGT